MPRSTESPAVPRDQLVKQALFILAIIVLGLGALGAHLGLRSNPTASEAMPLRTSGAAAAPAQLPDQHVANASDDVGPGEVESDLANCPPPVR